MTPFEDGYTAALRESLPPEHREAPLAPETIAAIRKDCAAFGQTWRMQEPERGFAQGEMGGRDFWWMRQRGALTDPPFPPLAVTLCDDGRVYLREAT